MTSDGVTSDVSVVIPAYNEADVIGRTLDALHGQDAEIVVVAGGTDDTRAVVDAHPAADRVIADTEESGPAHARNQGAEAASGDVLLFTDADTLVGPHWVERHRRHYADPDVVGTGGPIFPLSTALRDRLLFKLHMDVWFRLTWFFGFIHQDGANTGVRRSAFLAEDGYDEDIAFMEDIELSLRLRVHGTMVYDPGCWVRTSPRRQHTDGFLGVLMTDVQGFIDHFIRKTDASSDYFAHGDPDGTGS